MNTISEGSIGLQAGGNLTVNQTINELPNAIQDMFVELLRPSIKQLGENIRKELSADVSNSIGDRVKNALDQTILRSLREQIKAENLNYHIEMVIKRIRSEDERQHYSRESLNDTFKKTELFLEWMETAEDIPPQDAILSGIWQNWLYNLSRGTDNSEQKLLLDKMKQLTHEDADILLIHYPVRRPSFIYMSVFSLNSRPRSGKAEYITKKLHDLGLLNRSYFLEIVSFLVSITSAFFVKKFITFHEPSSESSLLIYLCSLILPMMFMFLMPNFKLTWLGSRIVSYAKPGRYMLNAQSFAVLEKEKVPIEVLKKLEPLKYEMFRSEIEFTGAISDKISKEEFDKYRELILKQCV